MATPQMRRTCCEGSVISRMGTARETAGSNVLPDDMTADQLAAGPDLELVARVTALIRDTVGMDVADPTRELLASGFIDSLSFVSLLLAIEQEYDIRIDVESIELADFQSIERIALFVTREMARSAAVDLPVAS
jgi:acyl carrier protein